MSSRLETIVNIAVGAGSACWDNLRSAGVFQSEKALTICEEAVAEIQNLIDEKVALAVKEARAKDEAMGAFEDAEPEDDMDKFRKELREEMRRKRPEYENQASVQELREEMRRKREKQASVQDAGPVRGHFGSPGPVVDVKSLHDTDDAMEWAEQFCDAFHHRAEGRRTHADELIEEGWMVGWFANAIEVAKRINREQEVKPVVEALRLTHEYVGAGMLPPIDGWDWYDVMKRYDPGYALKVEKKYHQGRADVSPEHHTQDACDEGFAEPVMGVGPGNAPAWQGEVDTNRVWALNEAKSLLADRETTGLGTRSRGASGGDLVAMAEYILNGKEDDA